MAQAQGTTWRAEYGEISEALQFRVGYRGQESWEAYFPIGQLSDLTSVLTAVQALGVGVLSLGTNVQARKAAAGAVTDVVIEPRSDTFPPQIMRLRLTELADLISTLQTLALLLSEDPGDWDDSKPNPIPESQLPEYLTQANLEGTIDAGVTAGIEATAVTKTQRYADVGGLYLPTPYADLVWRTRRAETLAGLRQAHIAIMGDSRSFGAAATGTTSPKYVSCYPGRLAKALETKYGKAGTGVVILNDDIFVTPAYDDRFTVSGTDLVAMGWHADAARRLLAASAGSLAFEAECSEFWIHNLQSNGGLNNVSIDGGATQTFRNLASTGATPNLPAETGYHSVHIVTKVPAGSVAEHTMTITTNGTNNAVLVAVEGRIPTPGTFRVSNPSISGKSLSTFLANQSANETSGLAGLPMIDMLRADLLLVFLGINDWQGQSPIATVKSRLTTIIQRQRGVGTAPSSGQMPGGDVMLGWLPKPDVESLVPGAAIPWEAYRDAYYEVADEQNCALIDFGARWNDFATGNAMGLFGDTIHENNKGSLDLSAGLLTPLGL